MCTEVKNYIQLPAPPILLTGLQRWLTGEPEHLLCSRR